MFSWLTAVLASDVSFRPISVPAWARLQLIVRYRPGY